MELMTPIGRFPKTAENGSARVLDVGTRAHALSDERNAVGMADGTVIS